MPTVIGFVGKCYQLLSFIKKAEVLDGNGTGWGGGGSWLKRDGFKIGDHDRLIEYSFCVMSWEWGDHTLFSGICPSDDLSCLEENEKNAPIRGQ